MTIVFYNCLAIQKHTKSLKNRPVNCYGVIFRHVRQDFIDITTRARMRRKTHCMGLNLKNWFCMSIKRKVDSGIVLRGFSYLDSLILHAAFTQPAKDSPSFLACCWINVSKSSSNRIVCLVLFKRSFLLFVFFSCIGTAHYDKLFILVQSIIKTSIIKSNPSKCWNTNEGFNHNNIKVEVMIMASSYDSAHLRAKQPQLYKFYNLSTAEIIQTLATTERQARKNLSNQSLIFIARIRINPSIEQSKKYGGYNHER